jgi:hypothetical protein
VAKRTDWAETISLRPSFCPFGLEVSLLRVLALSGIGALTLALAGLRRPPIVLREDNSRVALAELGQEYEDLRQWTGAVLAATDSAQPASAERARVLAGQLARLLGPLEKDFERTTAAMSTSQIDQVLPLWERMAFAHAGFVMLQEEATSLGDDPASGPEEVHNLADQLSAVLDFAAEIQQLILEELTTPVPTSIRVT